MEKPELPSDLQEFREYFDGFIAPQWSEEMMTAATIRALECGHSCPADHVFNLIQSGLPDDPGFREFAKEDSKLSPEDQMAAFVREYMGDGGL